MGLYTVHTIGLHNFFISETDFCCVLVRQARVGNLLVLDTCLVCCQCNC